MSLRISATDLSGQTTWVDQYIGPMQLGRPLEDHLVCPLRTIWSNQHGGDCIADTSTWSWGAIYWECYSSHQRVLQFNHADKLWLSFALAHLLVVHFHLEVHTLKAKPLFSLSYGLHSLCMFFSLWIGYSSHWWVPKVLWQSSDYHSTYSFETQSLPCNMHPRHRNFWTALRPGQNPSLNRAGLRMHPKVLLNTVFYTTFRTCSKSYSNHYIYNAII